MWYAERLNPTVRIKATINGFLKIPRAGYCMIIMMSANILREKLPGNWFIWKNFQLKETL